MRGIETSRTATSGRCCDHLLDRVDAVLGLRDHLDVGLAVEQQLHARADDAVVVGDQDLQGAPAPCRAAFRPPSGSRRRHRPGSSGSAPRASRSCPCPGRESISSDAADQQRALAHARQAEALALLGEREAAAVVGHDQAHGRRSAAPGSPRCGSRPNGGPRSRAPPGRPGRSRPARRAEGRRARGSAQKVALAGPRRSCSRTWVRSAATRPWSSSAVGRSCRARSSSSPIAWLARRFVSASSARSAGGRVLGGGLDPQQQRRQRLVDLVVQVARDRFRSSSCAWRTSSPERRRSRSRRSSMRLKVAASRWMSVEHARHLAYPARAAAPGARGRPAPSSPAGARAARTAAAGAAC